VEKLTGLGVSAGIVAGRAVILKQSAREFRFRVAERDVERELERLEAARASSKAQLAAIKERAAALVGPQHAYLFDAQLLLLDDPMLLGRAQGFVREDRLNAEWAIDQASDELAALFDEIEDSYLRERKGDLADVVGRVRLNLRGAAGPADVLRDLAGPCILVADELPASVAAQIDWDTIVGFATDAGSWTYHTAILARSLGVPAVVGLHEASGRVSPGAFVAIDGATGELFVDPDESILSRAETRARSPLRAPVRAAIATADGVRIRLEANLEFPEDLDAARVQGAEGIGLFRSEYLLARAPLDTWSEEHQYEVYRSLVEGMAPAPVTIRTFDVGEEQVSRQRGDGGRVRARLGLHAIRVSVAHRELFRRQIRALLRASAHGTLRIMFPLLSGLDELREAKAIVSETAQQLAASGDPPGEVAVGVMVEVPSAVLIADLLAREVAFFSIGTNDLIQFALALNRTDNRVSQLYEPLHPAILRAIRIVRRAARSRRLPVAVCGEMAADPQTLALLIGLGITEFSMAPAAIPAAADAVRQLRAEELARLARRALRCATAAETRQFLEDHLRSVGARS
jgi:phosphotransferase system enzyme I (PtsI)